jgi:hypothetical protein
MKRTPLGGKVVQGEGGELFVDGDGRTEVAAALAKLRAIPLPPGLAGSDFTETIESLERALSATTPLPLSRYFELLATAERTVAEGFLALARSRPPDRETADITSTAFYALSRSKLFEEFAMRPGDDDAALLTLLQRSGAASTVPASLEARSDVVVPSEAQALASSLGVAARSFAKIDEEGATVLARAAEALGDAGKPVPLSEHFGMQAEVNQVLARNFVLIGTVLPEVADRSFPEWESRAIACANAAAACGLLMGFFVPEDDADSPRVLH